jgi:rSAM/selenodomain-associated transferase 1
MSVPGRPPERTRVAVFAKAPVAGAVKTRLAAELGGEAAAKLHARLVRHALATAIAAGVGPVELWCAPDTAHPFFAACAADLGVALHAQQGDDLGARMHHAFAHAAATGDALVVIGADCPALSAQHLRDAATALGACDAVFAPAEDGGYVLAGLARPVAPLFEDIAWGGSTVMAQTRLKLVACRLAWKELATLWDVDRPEDLARLERAGWLAAPSR